MFKFRLRIAFTNLSKCAYFMELMNKTFTINIVHALWDLYNFEKSQPKNSHISILTKNLRML